MKEVIADMTPPEITRWLRTYPMTAEERLDEIRRMREPGRAVKVTFPSHRLYSHISITRLTGPVDDVIRLAAAFIQSDEERPMHSWMRRQVEGFIVGDDTLTLTITKNNYAGD